jgi:cytochrome oxidase Cu insertion factor (SCO1/SenC/PrrC family)
MRDFVTYISHCRHTQMSMYVLLCTAAFILTNCTTSSQVAVSSDVYDGTQLDGLAPDFQLTDQNNQMISLHDLRGNPVALTFLDSLCEDVCPLTSAQLIKTHQALGSTDSAIYLSVNVNEKANTLEDVTLASQKWHLDEIKTWHFLTGSSARLEPIWKAYNIEVQASSDPNGELLHTMGVYLIDKNGQLRWYISTPFVDANTPAPSLPLNELLTKHIQELLISK